VPALSVNEATIRGVCGALAALRAMSQANGGDGRRNALINPVHAALCPPSAACT
jgi:hypothetical protein